MKNLILYKELTLEYSTLSMKREDKRELPLWKVAGSGLARSKQKQRRKDNYQKFRET